MSKKTKLYIMFALAVVNTLVTPLLARWYEAHTGIYPVPTYFVLWIGWGVILISIITDDFDDFKNQEFN